MATKKKVATKKKAKKKIHSRTRFLVINSDSNEVVIVDSIAEVRGVMQDQLDNGVVPTNEVWEVWHIDGDSPDQQFTIRENPEIVEIEV